jgi:hypothetical protein
MPKQKKAKSRHRATPPKGRRWSAIVTSTSNALDLEPGVFTSRSPRGIAASLKRSADRSRRRRGTPLQSAMSMLNFYINRAGRGLSTRRKEILNAANVYAILCSGAHLTPSASRCCAIGQRSRETAEVKFSASGKSYLTTRANAKCGSVQPLQAAAESLDWVLLGIRTANPASRMPLTKAPMPTKHPLPFHASSGIDALK